MAPPLPRPNSILAQRKTSSHRRCCTSHAPTSDHPPHISNRSLTSTDQGQGGAQAIEDAVALGMVLTHCKPEEVEERIQIFQDIRIKRASVMQIMSNAGQDEAEKIQKDAAKFIPADEVPSKPSFFSESNLRV